MSGKRRSVFLHILLWPAILVCFLKAVLALENGQEDKAKEQLEAAVRRAAVACYAAEGAYPENLEYMQEHYGIQYDEKRYTIMYEVFASNLMPDITVLENER